MRRYCRLIESDGLFYIPVHIGGKRCMFLLDTGAEQSMINEDIAKQCKLKTVSLEPEEHIGIQGISEELFINISSYTTTDFKINNRVPSRIDTLAVKNLNVDGILGLDWLHRYKVIVNIRKKKISYYDLLSKQPKKLVR